MLGPCAAKRGKCEKNQVSRSNNQIQPTFHSTVENPAESQYRQQEIA